MTRITEAQELLCFKGISDRICIKLFDLLNVNNNFNYKIVVSVKK